MRFRFPLKDGTLSAATYCPEVICEIFQQGFKIRGEGVFRSGCCIVLIEQEGVIVVKGQRYTDTVGQWFVACVLRVGVDYVVDTIQRVRLSILSYLCFRCYGGCAVPVEQWELVCLFDLFIGQCPAIRPPCFCEQLFYSMDCR